MTHNRKGSMARFLGLLTCLAVLGSTAFFPALQESATAQTVSTPITRHIVLYHAYRYTQYRYFYQGTWHTSVPYAWGYGDWIDSELGPGGCANFPPSLFQHRLDDGCNAQCNNQAGDDCSGYVTRI